MSYIRWIASALFGSVLLFLAARTLDWAEVADSFRGFPWPALIPVLAITIFAYVVRAFRWQLLFPPEARVPVIPLTLIETTGTAMNSLVPVRVIAEPVQLFLLVARYGLDPGTTLATLVAVRVIDLVITVVLVTGGILLLADLAPLRPIIGVGWGLLALVFVGFGLAHWGFARLSWLREKKVLQNYLSGWKQLRMRRDFGVGIYLITAAQRCTTAFGMWLLARGLGIDVSYPEMVTLFLIAFTFAASLPSLPGVVGSFQVVWVMLLGYVGIAEEAAFSFSVLAHGVLFLPPLVIAVVTFLRLGLTWGQVREVVRRGRGLAGTNASP